MSLAERLAAWYIDLSPHAAAAIAAGLFIAFCVLAVMVIDWCDPLKREQRAVRRQRKHRRELLRDLQRASYHANRDCFREYTK